MHTIVGWTESVDQAAIAPIAAIPDNHVRVSADDIVVPRELTQIIGAYAVGVNLTRAQLYSPSLRSYLLHEIEPVDRSATATSPSKYVDLLGETLQLAADENLNMYAAEDGAGATRMSAFILLADRPPTPVTGDIRSVRVTGSTTLTAYAWTNTPLTFDQSLPAGRYQVVGGRFRSTGLLAWRLNVVGYAWRPGAPGFVNINDLEHMRFRVGNLGVWAEFNHNVPPSIECFSGSADTAEVGVLDLIKVG